MRLGAGCREFEPLHSDHKKSNTVRYYSFYFCIEYVLTSDILNTSSRLPALGYEHDRCRQQKQGVFIGVAVKIVSDEQERPTILGTARGGIAEDVGKKHFYTIRYYSFIFFLLYFPSVFCLSIQSSIQVAIRFYLSQLLRQGGLLSNDFYSYGMQDKSRYQELMNQ